MKGFFRLTLLVVMLVQHCYSQDKTATNILNGQWAIEFNSNDIGRVRSFLTFEVKDTNFTAYTRKGADRDILGYRTSALGRMFTRDFRNGSLINITNGKIKTRGDSLLLSGIFRSALGSYYFKGNVCKGLLNVILTDRRNNIKGSIVGSRDLPKLPLCDYSTLVIKALELTKDNIFNRALLEKKEWAKFEKSIRRVAAKMQDDVEMEFAFFYYAGKLPVSHYSLIRLDNVEKIETGHPANQVSLIEKTPATAYMKIVSFSGSAQEMDSIFSIILAKNYKNLVVDMRDNPGGTVEAGMKFATRVADSTFYGGIFLTQKWFAKNKNSPGITDYTKFPHFTDANFDLIIDGIHNREGLCLKIIPAGNTYKGKLYILTNRRTASTCEPIVYGLKQQGRAIIVGEKTAGAMLNGEFFKISDGFSVIIPTADYYAVDGYRIDKQGVVPTIVVDQAKALEYTMEDLIKK